MRKMVANWKMYLTIQESRELAALLRDWLAKTPCPGVDLIVCPSTLAIHDVRQQLGNARVKLGLQEISLSKELGAFTGQQSAQQAVEVGVTHALTGHSEMREFFDISDEHVARQVHAALAHDLVPIICVGETKSEYDQRLSEKVVINQLKTILGQVAHTEKELLIAYEPRWAIGAGKPLEPSQAAALCVTIQDTVKELGLGNASVLYGGSISAETIPAFLEQTAYQGFLVGSAGAKVESLAKLLHVLEQSVC